MTQNLAELERSPVLTDSFVELAGRVPTTDEFAEMAERWVQNPADRISSQLDELAVLYNGRIDRTTFYDFNGRNHQFDTFATRDADGEELEEIYTVYSRFSSQEQGYVREYSVTVLEADGHSYHMGIGRDGLSIQSTRQGGRAEVVDVEERDRLVMDFLYRSLIATVRTTDRPLQERQDADLDALIKLEQRTYDGRRKVVTATE